VSPRSSGPRGWPWCSSWLGRPRPRARCSGRSCGRRSCRPQRPSRCSRRRGSWARRRRRWSLRRSRRTWRLVSRCGRGAHIAGTAGFRGASGRAASRRGQLGVSPMPLSRAADVRVGAQMQSKGLMEVRLQGARHPLEVEPCPLLLVRDRVELEGEALTLRLQGEPCPLLRGCDRVELHLHVVDDGLGGNRVRGPRERCRAIQAARGRVVLGRGDRPIPPGATTPQHIVRRGPPL